MPDSTRAGAPGHRPSARGRAVRSLTLALGTVLVGVALALFLVPNRIIDGGAVGAAIMASHLSGLPLGLFLLLFNLPFLWLGDRQIGRPFTLATLAGVVLMSLWVTLLRPVAPVTRDPVLAAVFGGGLLGAGVGTVIRSGGSLDGAEIVAIVAARRLPFTVGELVLGGNLLILGGAGLVFGWDRAMYSLLAYLVAYRVIDLVVAGLGAAQAALVVTARPEPVARAITERLGRGVTRLDGRGGYTGAPRAVLYCVVSRLELVQLRRLVAGLDPEAFMAVTPVREVLGGRYREPGP